MFVADSELPKHTDLGWEQVLLVGFLGFQGIGETKLWVSFCACLTCFLVSFGVESLCVFFRFGLNVATRVL